MVALDELSKRNQASWHVEAFTPAPPAPTSAVPKSGQPSPWARRHLWPVAADAGGRFQSPRRFVPITLIVVAVLTAAALALADGIHSPQAVRQGTPRSPEPRTTSPVAASNPSTTLPGTTLPGTTLPSAPRSNATSGLVLQALSPGIGSPGQQITLSGSGFMGANGYIAATFDGAVVPTRCPTEQTCFVTIPAGSGEATVRLRTSAGESNSLVFHFESSRVS